MQGKVGVKFYRFPTDTELKSKWVAAIKRENWTPNEHSRLCSAHFITGKCMICVSYSSTLNIFRLSSKSPRHPDYIPSVFVFSKVSVKSAEDKISRMKRSLSRSNPGYQDNSNDDDDDDAGNSLESECIIEDESETTSAEDPSANDENEDFSELESDVEDSDINESSDNDEHGEDMSCDQEEEMEYNNEDQYNGENEVDIEQEFDYGECNNEDEFCERVADIDFELESKELEIGECQIEIEQCHMEIEQYQIEIEELKEVVSKYQEENALLKEKNRSLTNENAVLKAVLSTSHLQSYSNNKAIISLRKSHSVLQSKLEKSTFGANFVLNNDEKTNFYTGILYYQLFLTLFLQLQPLFNTTITKLSLFDEFFLTLVKLRLGVPHKDLAYRMDIKESSIGCIFRRWIDVMSTELNTWCHGQIRNSFSLKCQEYSGSICKCKMYY